MKRATLILGLAFVGSLFLSQEVNAQFSDMTATTPVVTRTKFPHLLRGVSLGVQNRFSPAPIYTYTKPGITAQRTHEWNAQQSQSYPWHGNYNYWRWQRPTALVVPPTASFSSEYNWGVGQTRSYPIYHQFGRDGGGTIDGGAGGGSFSNRPFAPWSTSQFGVYPVRAPWHH